MSSPGPDAWRDIDSDAAPAASSYLDAAAAALAAPRLRSHQLLGVAPGATVLDVGCGTGIALSEIAQLLGPDGTAVGLDPSAAMREQAAARLRGAPCRVELVAGSATDTGLESDRFDAVRTERVLMHVTDPVAAMRELARVTRPGGRLVLVEPDHRRLAVDTDAPDLWLRYVTAFGHALPNISAGLRAPADATALGLQVTAVEPMPFLFRTYDAFRQVFDLVMGRAAALDAGITSDELDALLAELEERNATGRFLAVGTMYVVVAQKPLVQPQPS